MIDARDSFFEAVRKAGAESQQENANDRDDRLENTVVQKALKAGGLGGCLKMLADECRSRLQLDDDSFRLSWFEDTYPNFPAKLLIGEAYYSRDISITDFLLNPKASPHFKSYFKALVANDVDDSDKAVCCVFRVGKRLQCVHNTASITDPFQGVTPAKDTSAIVLHTAAGLLCLQWYEQFLERLGTKWATND